MFIQEIFWDRWSKNIADQGWFHPECLWAIDSLINYEHNKSVSVIVIEKEIEDDKEKGKLSYSVVIYQDNG